MLSDWTRLPGAAEDKHICGMQLTTILTTRYWRSLLSHLEPDDAVSKLASEVTVESGF